MYDIRFKVDIQWQLICSFRLGQDDIKAFMDAIKRDYTFEMFFGISVLRCIVIYEVSLFLSVWSVYSLFAFTDSLPVSGFVGEVVTKTKMVDKHEHQETHYYLYTKRLVKKL